MFSFTLCLIGVNLGGMENIGRKILRKTLFCCVWQVEENKRSGKPGRLFSLSGPQNFSSQIGRKSLERKFSPRTFTVMPSPPTPTNLIACLLLSAFYFEFFFNLSRLLVVYAGVHFLPFPFLFPFWPLYITIRTPTFGLYWYTIVIFTL